MLTDPFLKQGRVEEVRKYRLGKRFPDLGNGWDKGFTLLRNALVRQPYTEIVR